LDRFGRGGPTWSAYCCCSKRVGNSRTAEPLTEAKGNSLSCLLFKKQAPDLGWVGHEGQPDEHGMTRIDLSTKRKQPHYQPFPAEGCKQAIGVGMHGVSTGDGGDTPSFTNTAPLSGAEQLGRELHNQAKIEMVIQSSSA